MAILFHDLWVEKMRVTLFLNEDLANFLKGVTTSRSLATVLNNWNGLSPQFRAC